MKAVRYRRCSRRSPVRGTIIAACVLALPYLSCQQADAYLRLHPENPHYFQETSTGRPVLIASYGTIAPSVSDYDYNIGIRELRSRSVSYVRVWHFLPFGGDKVVWPWTRSKVPGAAMGGSKFDMDQWNPTYWTRLKNCTSKLGKSGIYAEIHLFDRCGMSPASSDRWGSNPWASDNNVNNLETPTADSDGTPDFYQISTKPNLRRQQERYVRKMIDETIQYPNVIYEIENEHWEYDNPDFARYYAGLMRKHIAESYPKSPRLISYSSLQGDLESFYVGRDIDIVNKHYGGEPERDPDILNRYIEPRWSRGKAINIDEFANGLKDADLLRRMCWTILTSGGNFHIEDAERAARPFETVGNIRQFLARSGWDFVHSAPNRKLVTSADGYCMADLGREYVVYFPEGGDKRVELSPAYSYTARWWNPRTGGFSEAVTFSHTGTDRSFRTPSADDWVLYLRTDSSHKQN